MLEGAGLVDGARRPGGVCRLTPGPLAGAHEWVAFYERFWNQRLDALETLFSREEEGGHMTEFAVEGGPGSIPGPRAEGSTARFLDPDVLAEVVLPGRVRRS